MSDRRRARILAMQALCVHEALPDDFPPQLDAFLADDDPPTAVQDYARGLVRDAWDHAAAIDKRLQGAADNWDIARMAIVDRNILRVAVCELLHRPDVPPKAVIDEAIEIAKTFGAADSGAFINGILDAVLSSVRNAKTTAAPSKGEGT